MENRADFPTRKDDVTKLQMNDLWWSGPEWLKEDLENWPSIYHQDEMRQECEEEISRVSLVQQGFTSPAGFH